MQLDLSHLCAESVREEFFCGCSLTESLSSLAVVGVYHKMDKASYSRG